MSATSRHIPAGDIDWSEVRARLESAREGLREASRLTPEQARAVLEERARALAKTEARRRKDPFREMILFTVAGQRYAIESRFVVEVFRLADLALLPGAEPPVIGVVGWRGRLLTIVDLRAMLGRSTTALDELNRVIVLGGDRAEFGILSDTVEDIVAIRDADVRAAEGGMGVNERLVRGMTSDAVVVLEATELLRVDEDANFGDSTQ